MFMKRYTLLFLTTLAIFLHSLPAAAAAASNQAAFVVGRNDYSVNGAVYRMDVAPFIERERVFVPLRYLAYALGVSEKNVVWDASSQTIELHVDEKIIKLTLDNQIININNNINYRMDTSPVLRNGRLFLPAMWVAEALGYATGWDEKYQALLIGPPGNLPEAGSLPPALTEVKIRPCGFMEDSLYDSLYLERELSSSSIFFPYSAGEQANVYNAGVAARILNGLVLAPGQEFSFNRAVGERTTQKGFITGEDAEGNLTLGGGVCRTATVIFQAAKKAELQITERHPHSRAVHYTPPGTDAAVDWNRLDLKFINSRPFPLVIYSELVKEEKGRNLRAALFERRPLQKIKVAVIKETPQANLWESIEDYQLDSLVIDNRAYVSIEQLSDLFRFNYEVKEENGINKALINFNGQLINLTEKSKTGAINNTPFVLSGEPFTLPKCNCRFWLPLKDWTRLAGAEVLWIDRSPPLILLILK